MNVTPETLVAPEPTEETQETAREIVRFARRLHATTPDWESYFREVLGMAGIARRLCPTEEKLAQFEQTTQYLEIQEMLADLRQSGPLPAPEDQEKIRVITVRMPSSMHELLKSESFEKKTTMNKLCISKLLQVIADPLIPSVAHRAAKAEKKGSEADL